ncbi:MAG: C25 family cysteine peptidase [Chloroflexota bacterium]|nr:C25 family cysteine peptidase [Chloroflexota bacterium]
MSITSQAADTMDLIVRFPAAPLQIPTEENLAVFNESFYDHPADVGVPDLPVLNKEIEIPAADIVDVQILDSKSYAGVLGEGDLPASIPDRVPDDVKCAPRELCDVAQPAITAQETGIFPETPAQLINTYVIRGHQVAQLQFWPVQYEPASQEVVIYEEISVRLTIGGADPRSASTTSSQHASPAFEALLADSVMNYTPQVNVQTDRAGEGEGYLIVSPDAFISTLSPLVSLKESQGYLVTVAGLTTTGTSPDAIKSYIQNAYNSWPVPPTYVLLVGDVDNGANTMPAFIGDSNETVTDLYYGTVDGSDWVPDIFVGRLPARSTGQLTTMINNLVAYDGLTGAEDWVMKAAFLASNDSNYWDFAEATQNYVIDNHTLPAGYTGSFPSSPQAGGDKLYATSYSAGNANVVSAVNDRRSLIAYTGHGSRTSWGGPYFNQSNIRNISSTGVYSVVTSFACITGDFNLTESFGETWVLQSNKAAVAFIGSSANTFWGPDDIMERAMMDSLYSGTASANVVGSFRFAGLMAVEGARPGTGTAQSRYYWESYNVLGDPSLALLIGPEESDFSLSLDPSSVSVCQDAQSTAMVNVGRINGFGDPVTLSVSGAPQGVSADLSANPVYAPASSQLTLSAAKNAQLGDYILNVSGNGGGQIHNASLGLSVFAGAPSVVTLSNPANLSSDVSIDAALTWEAPQAGLTYDMEVATDSGFNQIVYSETGLTQAAFSPPSNWQNSTTYYWRVRASNACGSSVYSETFQFRTSAAPGDCPAGTVPTPLYQTDFESGLTGWSHSGTNDSWALSTNRSYSPSRSYFSVDKDAISKQQLVSPAISVPETFGEPVTLKFMHWFDLEADPSGCFDGAILEVSNNGGQSWSQIPDSLLLASPYTANISTSYGNPLGGSKAWCGLQDWQNAVVDLSQYAGESIKLRFTQATDSSIGEEGWYVDDLTVFACEAPADYRPFLNKDKITTGQAPGQEVTVQVQLTNAGINPDTYVISLGDSTWSINLRSKDVIDLQPGESTTLEVTVTVPADAEFGQIEEIELSATSQKDPDNPPATDETLIELRASALSFIPLVSVGTP